MSVNCTGTASGAAFPTVGAIIVPVPPGATPGNLLVIAIGSQANYVSGTGWPTSEQTDTPAGWTLAVHGERYGSPNPGLVMDVFYRFLDLGETEFQFQIINRRTDPVLYTISAWNGVDQSTPIDVAASLSVNTPAATTSVAPSRTTTINNALLLCHFLAPVAAGFVTPSFSTPAGMSARGYVKHDTNGGELGAFSQTIASAGATGTRTTTLSGGASLESLASSIAIRADQSHPTARLSSLTLGVRFGIPTAIQATPPAPVDDLLTAPNDSLVRVVARLHPYDLTAEAETPLYVATSLPSSSTLPAGVREILVDDLEVTRSIFGDGSTLGGEGSTSLGDLSLIASDGLIDALAEMAFDARDLELWVGGVTPRGEELDWSDYLLFLKAKTLPGVSADLDTLKVSLTDRFALLDRWVQLNRYAGTGGAEGGADLTGLPKPIGLGMVQNAEPRLLSKVPLVCQFHDGAHGAARALTAVYDEGIKLPSSVYSVNLSAGTFTLLTNPAGQITCDFLGPSAAGDRAASFFKWLSSTSGVGPLTYPNDFASDYFLAYQASQQAQLGLYLRDEAKIPDALNMVVAPLGFWTGSRLGKLIVGTIQVPFGQYDLDIKPWQVRRISRRPVSKPFSRVSIGWGKNWTKQDSGQLAGAAIASDHGLFAVQEYRTASYPVDAPDAAVLAAWPTAEERPLIPSLMVYEADAKAAAEDAFGIYGRPWLVYDVETGLEPLRTDLAKVQRLSYDRWSLNHGAVLRLLSIKEASSGCSLTLWGVALPVLMVFDDTYVMQFDTGEWMQF